MKEQFIQFLKDNGAYEKYVENFDSSFNDGNYEMEEFLNKVDPRDYVMLPFLWDDTGERDYWSDLDEKWTAMVAELGVTFYIPSLRQLCKEACALNRPTQHDELISTGDRIFGTWFEQKLKDLK